MSLLKSIDAEIERLERAIEGIPEVRQLRELRRFREQWSALQGQDVPPGKFEGIAATAVVGSFVAPIAPPPKPGRKMAPEREEALKLITDTLAEEILPIRTIHLAKMLKDKGIELGGNDPVNALSALLSTSKMFKAHGRSGWTLKKDQKSETAESQQETSAVS